MVGVRQPLFVYVAGIHSPQQCKAFCCAIPSRRLLGPMPSRAGEHSLCNGRGWFPRLLLTLTDEDFARAPYYIENSSHRKAIVAELDRVKALGVKPPQNLWEYKVSWSGT